jgi:hypothetical protein
MNLRDYVAIAAFFPDHILAAMRQNITALLISIDAGKTRRIC